MKRNVLKPSRESRRFPNRLPFLIAFCLLIQHYAFANVEQRQVFGVQMRWEAKDPAVQRRLGQDITEMSQDYTESWDPDCIWRKKNANSCPSPKHVAETYRMQRLAEAMLKETDGYFDIERISSGGVRQRDFAGMSEGSFLEVLRKKHPEPWLSDFAGDIYFSGGFTPSHPFTIADPIFELIQFASVQMKSGWMIASSGTTQGQLVWNPKSRKKPWKEEFQRMVVFARPEFDGGRLDAWSTALIPGGKGLLAKLWKNPNYRGKWAYLYFDSDGHPTCSENLSCDFKDAKNRRVTVPW